MDFLEVGHDKQGPAGEVLLDNGEGKKQLAEENEGWARLSEGVMRVLKYS
jgi:hypothetical protein